MIVAYATAPGRTASDTGEGGGIYAKVLAEEIVKPGVDSMLVFTRTARRVQQEIGQDPFLSASTMPELYFAANASPSVPAAAPPPAAVPESLAQPIEAERGWSAVKDSRSIAVLETFIAHFKDSFYAELAQARVAELRQQEVLAAVTQPAPPASPPTATPPALPVVAAMQPPAVDQADLARALQRELKRVGCLSGEVDGVWGEQSRSALRNFARQAKLDVGEDSPSETALAAASGARAHLCPPSCDDGERLVDGRCVARAERVHRAARERHELRNPSRVRAGDDQPRGGAALCFGADRGGPLVPCK
jgi:peptidoglycan hydrolase-like protein with peptidoglycan-binding domain